MVYTYTMTPTFDEIKEQYASTFLNEKTGKWSDATQCKIPTDPVITFNGEIINPSGKRTPGAQVEAYKAFKLACRVWNKTQNKGRSTDRHKPESRTAESRKAARIKENVKKKEERKQIKEEAANLVWWIVYPSATVPDETNDDVTKIARFVGCRETALNDTFVAMTLAQDWLEYAIKNKLSVSIEAEGESDTSTETASEPASVTTNSSLDETCSEVSSDESTSDQSDDEYDRPTSEDADGNAIFGPPTEQNMKDRKVTVYSSEFQSWFAQQTMDTSAQWEDSRIVQKYSEYNYSAHKYSKHHWDVTCLESALDMNCFFKWKVTLPKELVTQCVMYLEIGREDTDTVLHPQVSRMKNTFPVARYLAWGYCADGHKDYNGCDHKPRFGIGDIDFEAKHLKPWIRYAIKYTDVKSLSDLIINVSADVNKDFNATFSSYEVCLLGDSQRLQRSSVGNISIGDNYEGLRLFEPVQHELTVAMSATQLTLIINAMENNSTDPTKNFSYLTYRDSSGNVQTGFPLTITWNPNDEIAEITTLEKADNYGI